MRTRSRISAGTTKRILAAGVLIALSGLLVGCSGGSGGSSKPADAGAVSDSSLFERESGGNAKRGAADSVGANRPAVQTRAVIRTGRITVTANDLDQVRQDVEQLLFALGGTLDRERTSHDRAGDIERSTLVLRVPAAKFTAAMESLEKLGTMKSSNSTSKDVTTEVIDVNERVETLQNSLDRLQRFQRRSQDINALLRFEDQITNRQSELQSLEAQQAYLADQTSMSTITLSLFTPEKYVAPPDALEDAGFLAGLKAGWNALLDFLVVAVTVIGAILPFAVAFGLVGVPLWLLIRGILRRRNADPAPPAEQPAD